jgi:Ca2+-binding RTX toxin-like protein
MFRTVSNGAYAQSAVSPVDAGSDQRDVGFAALPGDGYVAVWFDGNYPGTVRAQRFDGNGRKVGAEVEVGQGRGQASVAATDEGGFLVAWKGSDGSETGIQARLFDAGATPLGPVITVSTTNNGFLEMPEVTALQNGGWVVVWKQQDNVTDRVELYGQILNAAGAKTGDELLLARDLSYYPGVDVAGLAGGGFAVTWTEPESAADLYGGNSTVRAMVYDASCDLVSEPIFVNTVQPGGQANSQLLALPDGGFYAVWADDGGRHKRVTTFNGNEGVWLQRFDAQGRKVGDDVRVGEAGFLPDMPTLALAGDGIFVTWSERYGNQYSFSRLKGQFLDLAGNAQGAAFELGNEVATAEYGTSALLLGNGSIVLGWNEAYYGAPVLQSQLLVPVEAGTAAADTFAGSVDRDYYAAGAGDDIAAGGAEADGLAGQDGDDRLSGGAGDDQLYGGAGQDLLAGGEGDDLLDGGSGGDTMAGGTGNDVYVVDSADTVTETAGEGTDAVRTALGSRTDFSQMYTLPANVENLTGTSDGGQGFSFNVLDNVATLGGGGDLADLQQGGNDIVSGMGGNDFLFWGAAFTNGDRADGGAGSDTVGLLGNYTLAFEADDLSSIEKLAVYSSGDAAAPNGYSLTMDDANVSTGQQMMVVAQSLTAGETLVFNGAAESNGSFNVRGGRGADTITGGVTGDIIWGNLGADQLRGGLGNDIFEYNAVAESGSGAADAIHDFAKGDRISLAGIDADGNAANGDSKFAWLGAGAFTGQAGQLRVTQDPRDSQAWRVEADVDGDAVADLLIHFAAPAGFLPEKSDFYL